MSTPLPTVLFFAGAFSEPSCFDDLAASLQKTGYPTKYSYALSLNPEDPSSASTTKDAQNARKRYLLPLLDEGRDVVVLVHSYGGVIGGQAARGLSKASRKAEGKAGGVIGLLYMVGNIVVDGGTLLEAVGGAYPPFIKQDYPSPGLAVIDPVKDTLYNDLDDVSYSALSQKLEAAMIPNALAAFETPATAPAWAEKGFEKRRAYIRTTHDQTNPAFLQDKWMEDSKVSWEIVKMETGHCPFITNTEETARIVKQVIEGWH
ncbi:prolyl aminopeptidase-like protein [Lophiotrema nucula]|uniref:Prolyl aminopeptidase-like protein n=1 Tax=Lophiotrema nucula TaxID=690887 RepID=A0A6A5ZK83_9PLEO|nr:prolyl aminopeptidase-like protein [Lophiotrema nucula]